MLSAFREGYPSTFGGFFKDPSGATRQFASYVHNSPPDVNNNSRILAVCGITDQDNDAGSPEEDGWFYSDFFAFHTLFYGYGASQKWLCCDKPADLLQKYGEYFHGNPHTTRRVVLNERLVRTELHDVTIVPPADLLNHILDLLRREAVIAAQQQSPLLLFLFGHGSKAAHAIKLGLRGQNLSISAVAGAVGGNVDLTIFSTACYYSGGWEVTSLLNDTVLSAAGAGETSESWPGSASLSRACGSIYASALVTSLSEESTEYPASSTSPDPRGRDIFTTTSAEKSKSFCEFARTVNTLLLTQIERFGFQHSINFSAQDDAWESNWRQRTGFPLVDFKRKWESLQSVPPAPASLLNRDPTAELDLDLEKFSLANVRGQQESISPYAGHLRGLASAYLDSLPGRDSLAPNSSLHQKCHNLIDRKKALDIDALEKIEYALRYRLSLTFYATQLVLGCGLPLPRGKSCEEWDPDWRFDHSSQRRQRVGPQVVDLFPEPLSDQGEDFPKPYWYLVAALLGANLSPAQLECRVQMLLAAARAIKQNQQTLLRKNPVIQSRGRRLAESY